MFVLFDKFFISKKIIPINDSQDARDFQDDMKNFFGSLSRTENQPFVLFQGPTWVEYDHHFTLRLTTSPKSK